MTLIPLSKFGLLSVEEAAGKQGVHVRTVQRWIADGLIPAVQVGGSARAIYLIRARDVERFTPPPVGWKKGRKRSAN